MQLPATFRNPESTVGAPGPTSTSTHNPGWTNVDNSGKFWVAGGGGGAAGSAPYTPGQGGVGTYGPLNGPWSGAGNASGTLAGGAAALQNTGSGGGGSERNTNPSPNPDAGNGGSGLVLIAYPT